MPSWVMSEELGRTSRASKLLRTARPSLVIGALLAFAALTAVVIVACDETGPSPIGEHFDDAGADTATPPEEDAGDEGGDAGEEEGGDAGADGAIEADAADAADGD
jgi:hypothetical protein